MSNDHPVTLSPSHPLTRPNPKPRIEINVRPAREKDAFDLGFIDELHKKNTHGLGFWPRGRFQGHLKKKGILIAETRPPHLKGKEWDADKVRGIPVGFLVYTDKYKSREDVGCIYAVCVKKTAQRSLIGAALVREAFERSSYGCKLFCCWCAQDLDAGYFWENLGFKPLAYRTGSEQNERIHIFWQKRIREEDTDTRWWYPSVTHGGVVKEGRLVLPIPPGVHWKDPKPMVLPQVPGVSMFRQLEGSAGVPLRPSEEKDDWRKRARELRAAMKLTKEQEEAAKEGRVWALTPEQKEAKETYGREMERRKEQRSAKKKETRSENEEKREYSEEYLQGARDLCAAWLDELQNQGDHLLGSESDSKYDVCRDMEAAAARSHLRLTSGAPGPAPGDAADAARALPAVEDDDADIIDAEFTVIEADDGDDDQHHLEREAA